MPTAIAREASAAVSRARLNQVAPDRSGLKIVILAAPKTGNAWLRSLLRYAYDLPIVELPLEWRRDRADDLPDRFVAHQHLPPSDDLYRWLVENRAVVLTTIRHPGDAFLSYFHFLKWQEADPDPLAASLRGDGERPGAHSLRYVEISFTRVYALSLSWARLGAHVVRYEDLLANPLARLRELTGRIAPVDEERLAAAVFLCRPEQMTRSGLADPRHLRTATAGAWRKELPLDIVNTMRKIQPYTTACRDYGYDWNPSAPMAANFDYGSIDPFGGRRHFDNGEPIGWALSRIYAYELAGARKRWPDPAQTGGDSFWNWLLSPCADAPPRAAHSPAMLSNVVMAAHRMRPDLREAMPDPAGADRLAMVSWFVGQASHELAMPWGLIQPVLDAYCDYLQGPGGAEPAAARTSAENRGARLKRAVVAERRLALVAALQRLHVVAVLVQVDPHFTRRLRRGAHPAPFRREFGGGALADHQLDAGFADRRQGLVVARQLEAVGRGQQLEAQRFGRRPQLAQQVQQVDRSWAPGRRS